jgi:hypothetical protein
MRPDDVEPVKAIRSFAEAPAIGQRPWVEICFEAHAQS